MMETNAADPASSPGPTNAPDKKNTFGWAKRLIREAPKPKGFSVTAAKRVMQLVAGQGKEPAALKVEPDGSFTIELVHTGKAGPSLAENPWDKVI